MGFNVPENRIKEVSIHLVNGEHKMYNMEKIAFEILENGILIYTQNANAIIFHPFHSIVEIEFRGEEEEKGENKVGD
mgnify:CR=1 FL=1